MAFGSVKELFDDACAHLVIDRDFCKRLHAFRVGFATKNDDHIAFFGGHLLGVHTVRFTTTEHNTWFSDLLQVDDLHLTEQIQLLPGLETKSEDTGAPGVAEFAKFKVAGNVFNLSCVWLTHAIWRSGKIPDGVKHEAMVDTMMVLQYRFLTSLLFNYFRHGTDPAIAEAVYASLTLKYDIKRYGSWGVLLRARSEDIVSKDSIHRRTIETFTPDKKVVYYLSDTQGRIRDMVKNIYAMTLQIRDTGVRVIGETSVAEFQGEQILKDLNNGLSQYIRYMSSIMSDRASFIKLELTRVIEQGIQTMQPKLFHRTLEWLSDNYRGRTTQEIDKFTHDVLVHAFAYMSEHRASLNANVDLPGFLNRLRGVYTSSRSTDPALIELREQAEYFVSTATHTRNPAIVAAVRTGLLLYIVARALTMRHYVAARVK